MFGQNNFFLKHKLGGIIILYKYSSLNVFSQSANRAVENQIKFIFGQVGIFFSLWNKPF